MSNNSGVHPIVLTVLALSCVATFQMSDSANAKSRANKIDGKNIFNQYCASCHQDGGNITVPSKSVAGSSKLSNLGVFKDYLNNPVGHMPYYKNIIEDEATLKALYKYCTTLHKQNIKQVSHTPGLNNKI